MKCSVVILNWNGAQMLRRYLPSVVEHTHADGVEIVVADNGSTDDSIEVLKDFPTIRVIELKQNYGFAQGYNLALEHIDAEYVVLLNSDVEVKSDWLEPLLAYMDSHPSVAAVQPKILSAERRSFFEHAGAAGGYLDCLGYPYCRGRVLGKVEEDKGQYDTEAEVFWTSGACMCARTCIYKELGGLDEHFFAHMEEIDLCWRMLSRGYQLYCLPESVVYHVGGGSLGYESPKKTYLNFRNNQLMLYKNLFGWRYYGVFVVRAMLDYVAALQMFVTGKKQNGKAIIEARRDFYKMVHLYRGLRRENQEKAIVTHPKTMRGVVLLGYTGQ